ncbi:hypothetical protein SLOPH_601 [Spraguea lophii 42_110]|uniref:PUM-HD domain-containing protein n=1 Tax=Spraguea lophii (strain 42_110) TaxID=1358809 RepID=S7W845_SPRLO|nr:hypothetical protein SLOPH_601 [Spraguea lophii 42_110]
MNRSSHKRKYPQNSKSQNIVNTSTPIKKSKSTDIIAQLTPIWEICRKKKLARPLRDENINKLKYILYKNNDIINEQILKKRGSRILQTFIKYCNADDLEIFYNTIKNNLNDIVISKYGKFIIQSLLTEGYRNKIINDIDIKRVIRDRVGHFILNEIYLCNNTKSKKKKNKNDNDDNKNKPNIKETSNSYVNIKDKILRTILLPNHLIILEKSERIDVYPSNAYKGYKTISKLISKNIINTELAHDLIKLQIKKSKTKIFKKLKKVVVDLLHTDSGLYVAKKMILEYNKNIEIQDNYKNDDKPIINIING